MTTQPLLDLNNQRDLSENRLPRSLSVLETWGFGLTGHVGWISGAAVIHVALGPQAMFVWAPGAIVSFLLTLQVQRLGRHWSEMSGGTPNYAAKLLQKYPGLARYVALGYFIGWASAPAVYSIILTDLIASNLEPFGISTPGTILKIGFSLIAFIVAFSGTRALAILHLFFVIPAIVCVLAFCVQGIGWLAFSNESPGFFPPDWSNFNFGEWAKWFFISTYPVYACETASSFVADSQRPRETLRFLTLAAWLIPPVFLGGSWVLMRLDTQPGLGDSTFLNFLAAAKPFWGQSASFLVTLLIAFSCLLSCATAVSNCPRILYQLARDGHLSPVFAVVSRRGVLAPALVLTLLFSLVCLVWGDLSQVLMVAGTGWLASIMGLHLGLWLGRGRPGVLFPWWSLGFFLVETVVLVVGGWAWSWQNLLIGLLLPLGILAVDATIRRLRFAPFQPAWWQARNSSARQGKFKDFVVFQVGILIVLVCSTATIGWTIRARLDGIQTTASANLLIVLLIAIAFVEVAIACWTSLPQVAAIVEAREQAEHLFSIALDAILVIDEQGAIAQVNPAAESLFGAPAANLLKRHLNELLPELPNQPTLWSRRSEQILTPPQAAARIVEVAISDHFNQEFREYVVILRDITERQQLARQVQQLNTDLEHQVQERTNQLQQALEFEAALKRITDQVRDSLDESQILQIVVQELALKLQVISCDTAIYNAEHTTSTIRCDCTSSVPSAQGQVIQMATSSNPELYEQLLQGWCCQFCFIVPNLLRPTPKPTAILACPVLDDRGVLGDMWLMKPGDCSFNELELRLVQQVANQCAIAIRQARLYQATQAQVEELEKVNQLKDHFLSTVSHELRTPVANMKMAIRMLQVTMSRDYQSSAKPEKAERYLEILHTECEREISLINDLLDLQKLEAESQPLSTEAIQLQTWLPQLIQSFQVRTQSRQQSLVVDVRSYLPPFVSNPSSLERILSELINNACKYTPAGEQIEITASAESGLLQLKVTNTGIEIPIDEQSRIFDKFYRVPSHDPWQQSGTGLGLAIVKQLTQRLGGTIRIESAANQTCFTVEFPLSNEN